MEEHRAFLTHARQFALMQVSRIESLSAATCDALVRRVSDAIIVDEATCDSDECAARRVAWSRARNAAPFLDLVADVTVAGQDGFSLALRMP